MKLYLLASRFTRGMTLGVRALVHDRDRVLLVRHSYLPGWYLPGGGVEPGETMADAVAREVREEGGVALDGPGHLFGIYLNRGLSRRDHVALYVCRDWSALPDPVIPNREILEARFFPRDALPDGATPSTAQRLAEVFDGAAPADDW